MNFFSYTFCCVFSISMKIQPGLSKIITSQSLSRRPRVIVFDIDNTLFTSELSKDDLKTVGKNYPECPIVNFIDEDSLSRTKNSYVFLPYLKILFDYLIKQDARIVFFSGDFQKRNQALISSLLASLWDQEDLDVLIELGQFNVFSGIDLFQGNFSADVGLPGLKRIIRQGDLLSDVILVVDDKSFIAYDQKPLEHLKELFDWFTNKTEEVLINLPKRRIRDFPLNSVYFMHGVFMTYFEHEKCNFWPYHSSLPKKERHVEMLERNPFGYSMIDRGLSEVQKQVPDAIFYGSRFRGTFSYSFTFPVFSSTSSDQSPRVSDGNAK